MAPVACHFNTYLSASCEKIPGYLRVLARQMADRFVVFRDFHCKFIHQIVKLLLAWRMLLVYTSVTPCQCTKLSLGERHELCAKQKEKHVLGTLQAQV